MYTGSHGFLYRDGAFVTIDFPESVFTEVTGINNKGQVVGSYTDSKRIRHGFAATYSVAPPETTATLTPGPNGFG